MLKRLYFLLSTLSVSLLLLAACQNSDNKTRKTDNQTDSADIRIALMPIEECAPFYFAQEAGIYDSLGIQVRLVTYNSQFDCDTAIMNQRVDMSISDKNRMTTYGTKAKMWEEFNSLSGQWGLAVSGQLRVRKPKDLNNRLIGTSRLSASNWWLQHFLNELKIEEEDIFQIQINDIPLRLRMLLNNQIDAAILPEPYLSIARLNGAKIMAEAKNLYAAPSVMLVNDKDKQDARKKVVLDKVKAAYRTSLFRMKSYPKPIKDSVLTKYYQIPAALRDSVRLQ